MASKPVFAIVPGAFHLEQSWDLFDKEVHDAGYESVVSRLSSTNDGQKTLQDDVLKIREVLLLPLLDSGRDVVLILHSFGGVSGSAALGGLAKSERQSEGLEGGVVGVIYVAAFVPTEGMLLRGAKWQDWQTEDLETGLLHVKAVDAKRIFYADVPGAVADTLTAALVGHSVLALSSRCPPVHYGDLAFKGRRAYIRCAKDQTLPHTVQDALIKGSGVAWNVVTMDTSHSPFASQPAALWANVKKLTESFLGA